MSKAWVFLIIAGVLEVGWSVGLKYSEGFTKPLASSLTIAAMVVSMFLLSKAAVELPIGTAYAVWVGIGACGAAVLGIALFKEPASGLRLLFLAMLVVSILGLKLTSSP